MNTSTSPPLTLHRIFPPHIGGIVHGYSTRGGGVSAGPYATLNLGDHVYDEPAHVRKNRETFSKALSVPATRWVTAEQVHRGDVARVTEADAGRKIPGVDALITDTPRLPLALFYADCASLYLVDTERHAIGLAHAGWRGTAAEIANNTVAAMASEFGSRPEELWAGLGPHIGACCYEVGEEVAQSLGRWDGAIRSSNGSYHADLGAANRAQLLEAGLRPDRIVTASPCTACHPDRFFSYRRDGPTGRMAALLMLE